MTVIAAYGTLRRGYGNNRAILSNAKFLGQGETSTDDYTMYSAGMFPFVTKEKGSHITVELFEVDDDTLARCDRLEGHPDWYRREEVETTIGPAWMYLMPATWSPRAGSDHKISSGDWNEHTGKKGRQA